MERSHVDNTGNPGEWSIWSPSLKRLVLNVFGPFGRLTSNLGPEGCSLEETAVPAAGACPALVPRKAHGWQATVASASLGSSIRS